MYYGEVKEADAAQPTGTFEYTCIANTSIAGEIEIGMKVNPSLSLPDSVEPNGEITLDNVLANIEIDLTGNLDGLRGLINPFNGHVNHFNMVANGQTVNVVGDNGVAIPETPHSPEDSHIPFTVSGIDSKFTAGEADTEIHVGEIEAIINAKLGIIPVDLTVVCTPPSDTLLATVSIDEADEVAPVITLTGDNPMELEVGEEYVEPGATAEDNVDGDVTDSIKINGEVNTGVPGEYEIVYTVSDAAGNEATEIRIVNVVDKTAPVITLTGDNPMELEVGEEYVEPGATAEDNVDGDVTDSIKISSDVNTEEAGTYEVVYTVSDSAGNTASETRVVKVVETEEPGDGDGEEPGDGDNGENPKEPEVPGGTWFTGEGAPEATQGSKGDLYLDTVAFDIYEKSDEGWQFIGNLKGEDGQDGQDGEDGQDGIGGATWLVGEGAPNVDVGNNGDLYLDTVSGDIYVKSKDGWDQVGNLQGPPGKDGADGQDGEDGKDGADGQDGEDGKDGADGQDGEDGKDGADGQDGEDGKDGADGQDGEDGKDGADGNDSITNSDNDKGNKTGNNTITTGGSKESDSGNGSILPKTATNNPLLLALGIILSLVGGTLVFIRKEDKMLRRLR